jgi:hypothetical protein
LAAFLFYRIRNYDQAQLKAIIEAVQPYRARTINPASEMEYFKGLIMELQTDICRSHELIARLWLNIPFGQVWLDELAAARKLNYALPRATPDRIALDFQFTPREISSLWTPILSAAHPDHWNEQSWEDGLCDDYIFDSMESASYVLIAKMVTGLHIGVRAHRTTNVTARLRMLASISNLEAPDRWPQLPVDGTSLPDTQESWKGYPDFYPVCHENPDFAGIFARFGDPGPTLFTKLVGKPFPEPQRPPNPTPVDTDVTIDTQQPNSIDLTREPESSQNGTQPPIVDISSQATQPGTQGDIHAGIGAQQDTQAGDHDDHKIEDNADEYDAYDPCCVERRRAYVEESLCCKRHTTG